LKRRDIARAFASVLLAAIVSLAGAGGRALVLASAPDRAAQLAHDGHDEQRLVAHHGGGSLRAAIRSRAPLTDHGGRPVAAIVSTSNSAHHLAGERLALATVSRGIPRPPVSSERTSRGPPQG
jgi:hypothetical protein